MESGLAPGLWKVSARVAFDFHPQSFYPLLGRIAGSEKAIVVESLTIRSASNPRAEARLVAYFQKPAPPNTGDVAGQRGQR